jgi:hypothetical protein
MLFVDMQKAIAVDTEAGAEVAVTKDAARAVQVSLVEKLPTLSAVLWTLSSAVPYTWRYLSWSIID